MTAVAEGVVPYHEPMTRWIYRKPGTKERLFVAYAPSAATALELFRAANLGLDVVLEGVREESPSEYKVWEQDTLRSRGGKNF